MNYLFERYLFQYSITYPYKKGSKNLAIGIKVKYPVSRTTKKSDYRLLSFR